MSASRTQGTDALIHAFGNSCLSLTHRNCLSGWPCSQALTFDWILTERHPLTLPVMANSLKDHARDDGSEDYQSFFWGNSFNAPLNG